MFIINSAILKKPSAFLLLFLCCYLLASCISQHPLVEKNKHPRVNNIILIIGDGMGPQQLGLLEEYARRAPASIYQGKTTGISRFALEGSSGFSLPGAYNALVVDSACSATQLATGLASRNEMVGLDINGDPAQTILQYAKTLGKSTGLVSDTRITHATPAAFASHQATRSMENEIAAQMIHENQVDVMLSGGLAYFLPDNAPELVDTDGLLQKIQSSHLPLVSKRKDKQHLLAQAQMQHYQLAFTNEQLSQIKQGRVLGLFASSAMQDGTRQIWQASPHEPSLKDMTIKALSLLEKNPQGFFLMIEGGQIDWAAHNNDAGRLLHELLRFDEAIQAVYEWAENRNDTLVIITADHETGGFGFSYSSKDIPPPLALTGKLFTDKPYAANFNFGDLSVLDNLYQQRKSFVDIWQEAKGRQAMPESKSMMESINNNSAFKISLAEAQQILLRERNEYHVENHKYLNAKEFPKINDFKEFYVYGDEGHLNLMGRALAKHQNTVWSTGTHTHTPVPVISWGPVHAQFNGIQTHIELGEKIRDAFQ